MFVGNRAIKVALALALLALVLTSCGAEGTPAPANEAPSHICKTIDEMTVSIMGMAREGELGGLAEVVDRLTSELNGGRIQQALELILGVLQTLPREETTEFEFQILLDLVDQAKQPLSAILDYIATGPDSRRFVFGVLDQAMNECPRDSLILTVSDIFQSTDLMAALGTTLDDPRIVELLTVLPDQPDDGKDGFKALLRTIINAVQAETFEFSDLRELLAFLSLDEPPMSDLLTEVELYLSGSTFDHLVLTLDCIESTTVYGVPGVDVLGALLYDLISLEELDIAGLLTLAAPLLAQLQEADIQVIGRAALDTLIVDIPLREKAISLISFFFREDNLPPLMEALTAMLEGNGFEEVIVLLSSITVRCPDPPPSYGVVDETNDE